MKNEKSITEGMRMSKAKREAYLRCLSYVYADITENTGDGKSEDFFANTRKFSSEKGLSLFVLAAICFRVLNRTKFS